MALKAAGAPGEWFAERLLSRGSSPSGLVAVAATSLRGRVRNLGSSLRWTNARRRAGAVVPSVNSEPHARARQAPHEYVSGCWVPCYKPRSREHGHRRCRRLGLRRRTHHSQRRRLGSATLGAACNEKSLSEAVVVTLSSPTEVLGTLSPALERKAAATGLIGDHFRRTIRARDDDVDARLS